MGSRRLELELPAELWDQLEQVARTLGYGAIGDAAVVAIGDWVSRRKAEADDRDPSQRYFVNEALDELETRKK